ncbi:MAG: glycosyltransferase [Cyclobacteriaceae bacterium]|nr:glycosyltransferase [Cyclobacteriaceae bacterium]
MEYPLVSIICICYNQKAFIKEALDSVWALDYPNVELIVADDASTDGSQELIKQLCEGKEAKLLLNKENVGHCKTFNLALKQASGEFVIDLSGDDVLLPNSVSVGAKRLLEKGEGYGVFFADALLIDDSGKQIGEHKTASFFKSGVVPQGDVYATILGKYFINPPTMMYRKSLVEELGGYNEALAYEDFDFWVRSSRMTNYCYASVATVKKRMHGESVSAKQYVRNSKMLASTFEVCKTAFKLNQNKKEDKALLKRLAYEAKMTIGSSNFSIGFKMMVLSVRVLFRFVFHN